MIEAYRHLLTGAMPTLDDPPMPGPRDGADDRELPPAEAARARRRDRDADAQARDLLRPGMGKVFKQIQDAQAKAAKEPPKRRRGHRP